MRPNKQIFLITGDDEARIRVEARAIIRGLVGESPDAFALEICKETEERGPRETLADAIGALNTPSFLGTTKTVWLQDFSGFAVPGGAAAKKHPVAVLLARLTKLISGEFPPDTVLVMSGPGVDGRSRFFKACSTHGEARKLNRPDLKKRDWREQVARLFRTEAEALGMALPPAVVEYLIEVVGIDTARIPHELEKVFCYAGERPSLEQVQNVCTGSREAVYFALTDALGKRDLGRVSVAINRLLANTGDPERAVIGLIRQAGKYFRDLLHAKLLMACLKLRKAAGLESRLARLTEAEQTRLRHNPVLGMHPYRARMLASQADLYTGPELIRALHALAEADRRLVSTSLPKRLVLEELALRIVLGSSG